MNVLLLVNLRPCTYPNTQFCINHRYCLLTIVCQMMVLKLLTSSRLTRFRCSYAWLITSAYLSSYFLIAFTVFLFFFLHEAHPAVLKFFSEPPQTSLKYLTWPRTTSSHASSPNRLGVNSADNIEDVTNNLFDNFCMVSGSHASTLDRLFAWEKKLYDELKVRYCLCMDDVCICLVVTGIHVCELVSYM